MAKKPAVADKNEVPIEDRLKALYQLQQVDSSIDRIRVIRGELPIEVSDLEDEIIGLETRVQNLTEEAAVLESEVSKKKQQIKESKDMVKKYEGQQNNVKNNREYDSLTKEIEFQNLEIKLSEKRIGEFSAQLEMKKETLADAQKNLDEKKLDLEVKKSELNSIIAETQKEEEQLQKKSSQAGSVIEDRLLSAYKRIRDNARNGLAVVPIQRDACGGCFNKIPPQRQLDIRQHKKIIVCEHCGRILVDANIAGEQN